jgi:uncharacterized protein (TIGR02611 family)
MAPVTTTLRSRVSRLGSRVSSVREHARRTPAGRIAWRAAVTVAGVAVIAIGVVLLPLPGPGWLIIFGGLGLLATEYAWAARLLGWARAQVARWTAWVGRQPRWAQVLVGLAALIVLAGVVLLVWEIYRVL